jgi:2'-5' RNA ligase
MRCFIAVELDPTLTQKIIQLQNQLKNLDVKPVGENNLHFTLKFLGEIPESTANKVKEMLSELALSTRAFPITLHGVGIFPNENYIRVIWVGSESQAFASLHHAVNDALAKLFKKEHAAPHLTIARVRSGRDNAKIMDFVKRHKNAEIGSMQVDKIKLKKSVLMPSGPIYDDAGVFELTK